MSTAFSSPSYKLSGAPRLSPPRADFLGLKHKVLFRKMNMLEKTAPGNNTDHSPRLLLFHTADL